MPELAPQIEPAPARSEEKGFLEEAPGEKSSMRLMSMVALAAAVTFGLLMILHEGARNGENGLYITFGFLLAAFAPKAVQKFAEESTARRR